MQLVARKFEFYPRDNAAARLAASLVSALGDVGYTGRISEKNSNQITTDFDAQLEAAFATLGAERTSLALPDDVRKEYDFAFKARGTSFVVEVEKANREKILYDILKCHMYLASADAALLFLPRVYPHTTANGASSNAALSATTNACGTASANPKPLTASRSLALTKRMKPARHLRPNLGAN